MLKELGFIKLAKKEDQEGPSTLFKILLGAAGGAYIGSPIGKRIAKATKWKPFGKLYRGDPFNKMFRDATTDFAGLAGATVGGAVGGAIGGVADIKLWRDLRGDVKKAIKEAQLDGNLGKKATINVDGKSNKNINSSTKPAKVPITKGTTSKQAPNPIKTLKLPKAKTPKYGE